LFSYRVSFVSAAKLSAKGKQGQKRSRKTSPIRWNLTFINRNTQGAIVFNFSNFSNFSNFFLKKSSHTKLLAHFFFVLLH
jgi:hypothetical protein